MTRRVGRSLGTVAAAVLLFVAFGAGARMRAQGKKEFAVSAHRYSYTVAGSATPEIRVQQGDLVRITFSADDIPHSFTIVGDDHYRIMRRAEPGQPVTFDFLADQAGRFTFQCTLRSDDRCRELSGTLIVAARKL